MSLPSSLKGFDVEAAVERMLGQDDLWWAAVRLFVQHFANWEAEWQAAQGDEALECKKVHALRSAAANVGANKLACAAAVLEDLLVMRLTGKGVPVPPSIRWYVRDSFREAWRSASEAGIRYAVSPPKEV